MATDNSLWISSPSGLSHLVGEQWQAFPLATCATTEGALALAQASDGTLWVGGDNYIAYTTGDYTTGDGQWQVHTAIDQPLLADRFATVTIAAQEHRVNHQDAETVVFGGSKRELHFDGTGWRAVSLDSDDFVDLQPDPLPPPDVEPPPLDFPAPTTDYQAWLQRWPRPARDNGCCMHFVQTSWLDVNEAQLHIDQLRELNARWVVVPYANHFQLRRLAPLFAQAELMVI